MYTQSIASNDAEVNDLYAGIVCHDEYIPRHSWCPGCEAKARVRESSSRPLPAEAACCVPDDAYDSDFDGFLSEPVTELNAEWLSETIRGHYRAAGTIR